MTFTKEHVKQNKAMLKQAKAHLLVLYYNPLDPIKEDRKAVQDELIANFPEVSRHRIDNAMAKAVRQILYEKYYK